MAMMTSHYTETAVAAVAPAVAKTHNDRHKNEGKSRLHSTLAVAAVAVSTSRQDSKNFVLGNGKNGTKIILCEHELDFTAASTAKHTESLAIQRFSQRSQY